MKKRILFVLSAALFFVPFFGNFEATAAGHEITEEVVGYYDQYHNGQLQKHYQAKMHKLDGEMAYCISMTKTSEPGSAQEVNIQKFLPGDELVMACLAQKYIFSIEKYSAAEKYMLTQCMVWYIQREHIGDGGWRQYVSGIDMSVSEQKTFFAELEQTVKKDAPRYEGRGTAWENIDFEDVQEVGILLAPVLKTGELSVEKMASEPDFVKGNQCYSLAGAKYEVFSDADCKNSVGSVETDQNGKSGKVTLGVGRYYVREIKASPGYELDTEVYPVDVVWGQEKKLSVREVPAGVPLQIRILKKDSETGESPQGEAQLAGAEFTVCYYDGYYSADNLPEYESYDSKAKRKWVLRTIETVQDGEKVYCADIRDSQCIKEGDHWDTLEGEPCLPLGTISIEETQAPEGYTLDGAIIRDTESGEESRNGIYVTQITQNSHAGKFQGDQKFEALDRVIRGDLSLRKIDEKTQKAMAGISFRLTSVTTGEAHDFMTDENGMYSTSGTFQKHSKDTNSGNAGAGLWFGTTEAGDTAPVDDSLGALPYDTYELEEIRNDKNAGRELFKDTVVIRRDQAVVHLNNLENHWPEEQTGEPAEEKEPERIDKPLQEQPQKAEIEKTKTVTQASIVRTGDGNSLMLLVILLILSCTVIFVCGRIARKD